MTEYDVSDSGEAPVDPEGLFNLCKEMRESFQAISGDLTGQELQTLILADFLKGIMEQLIELTNVTRELTATVQSQGRTNLLRQRGRDN